MNVAFIPVRGGSKSIPLKNIKSFCGKPLVYWAARAAAACEHIDLVYVATDSGAIRDAVAAFQAAEPAFAKLRVIGRSAESATDTADTEAAMLEFAERYVFDNIVLIQATSPLLLSGDLERGFAAFAEDGVDSVLAVVRQKRFYWQSSADGFAQPINYDVFNRPRRQDFGGCLVENGAFYITSKQALLKSKNRISGNIKAVEMDEDSFFEIDEPADWTIVEALMKKRDLTRRRIPEIKMLLTDCDGCLTDGGMYYSEKGDELKKFNTRDGMGFQLLRRRGILTGIVTGERVALNRRRAEKLKLDIFEDGCQDKAEAVQRLAGAYGIALENILYIGDDINDLEAMRLVGYCCCPADAVGQVRELADFVTEARGGEGVIREVADTIIGKPRWKNERRY